MPAVARSQFVARVSASLPLCREHFRLILRLDEFPPTEPGQFVQLLCRDGDRDFEPSQEWDWQPGARIDVDADDLASPVAMLRRPFSLAGRRDFDDGVELHVIHRVVGVGTDATTHRCDCAASVALKIGTTIVFSQPGHTMHMSA